MLGEQCASPYHAMRRIGVVVVWFHPSVMFRLVLNSHDHCAVVHVYNCLGLSVRTGGSMFQRFLWMLRGEFSMLDSCRWTRRDRLRWRILLYGWPMPPIECYSVCFRPFTACWSRRSGSTQLIMSSLDRWGFGDDGSSWNRPCCT